jgi:hypothetical protein
MMRLKQGLSWCVVAGWLAAACGGGDSGAKSAGAGYEEYECPAPVGRIVREECSKIALRYEGENVEASAGVGSLGASASYKQEAIREADQLVQMLKEQRVGLCNDFNTCKLSVPEYRSEKTKLDDSYVALLAIKDKLKDVDADGAVKLLQQIRGIEKKADVEAPASSSNEVASPAPAASASAPSASAAPAPASAAAPAAAQSSCTGPTLQLASRGDGAGANYQYPLMREALRGRTEFAAVKFLEFAIPKDLSGKVTYMLVAVVPDMATQDKLRTLLREKVNKTAGQDISCPTVAPARELKLTE